MIDLETFDVFPRFSGQKVDSWDVIGILAKDPRVTSVGLFYRWELTIFQNATEVLTIEFDTNAADEEPKFQRLQDPIGCLVFVKHIKPQWKGHAGLYTPFGQPDQGQIHYNHRTIIVMDTNREDLIKFEKVRMNNLTKLTFYRVKFRTLIFTRTLQ